MTKLLLVTIIVATVSTSLFRPWIGILAWYTLAIMGPQFIWGWIFEGLRVSWAVASFLLVGFAARLLQKQYDFIFLKTWKTLWVFLLFIFIAVSYFFGPYVASPELKIFDPINMLDQATKIFVLYLCASIMINNSKKLHYFSILFIVTTIYLTYWANEAYLSMNFRQFNMGRLMGPFTGSGGGIYRDENLFGLLFVTGLPFLYHMGFYYDKKWLRYSLWGVIPFGWHAIFLTASRGALVGLVVTILISSLTGRRKFFSLLLIPLFLLIYVWQAGDTMKGREMTIQGEGSVEARRSAWLAATKMILSHPITGVGLASFMSAFPDYSPNKPRVAHNTFLQFAAESGAGAGLMYILIIINFFLNSRTIRKWCYENEDDPDVQLFSSLNNSSATSFAGLTVCASFASTRFYEIFFYLLVINNSLSVLCSSKKNDNII